MTTEKAKAKRRKQVKTKKRVSLPPDLERRRLISIAEWAELKNVSVDTVKRHYAHLIVRVSPRRLAMRLGDALDDPSEAAA